LHHGPIDLDLEFDDVLNYLTDFLRKNPSETVVVKYKKESFFLFNPFQSFSEALQSYLDNYSDIIYTGNKIPQLDDIRGKVLLLNKGGGKCGNGSQGLCERPPGSQDGAWNDDSYESNYKPNCDPDKPKTCSDYVDSLTDNMIEATESKDEQLFYVTWASATQGGKKFEIATPLDFAQIVNPQIEEFIQNPPVSSHSFGIVVMDYITADLTQAVFMANF